MSDQVSIATIREMAQFVIDQAKAMREQVGDPDRRVVLNVASEPHPHFRELLEEHNITIEVTP